MCIKQFRAELITPLPNERLSVGLRGRKQRLPSQNFLPDHPANSTGNAHHVILTPESNVIEMRLRCL